MIARLVGLDAEKLRGDICRCLGRDAPVLKALLEGGQQAVVFGDVSGKSVSGALMMMAAHEALHTLAMTRPRPDELFNLTNRRLYDLGRRSFVALGYFCVSNDGQRLRYLIAGQPPPLLRRKGGEVCELTLAEHRVPIGAFAGGGYRVLEVELEPGDLVLGYSDGVTEAHAPGGEMFGDERLAAALARAGSEPERVVRSILDEVAAFTRGAEPYDDITLVAIARQAEASR